MTRVLIDTHALVWWFEGSEKLSRKARQTIEDADTTVIVSAASAWELAIKVGAGKFKSPLMVNFQQNISDEGFLELPVSIEHVLRAGKLPGQRKDPFDRMLIAQAKCEGLAVLSVDECFDTYGVGRIW